jgi:hypothetical protein
MSLISGPQTATTGDQIPPYSDATGQEWPPLDHVFSESGILRMSDQLENSGPANSVEFH